MALLLLGPRSSWSGQHRGRWAGRAGENVGRQMYRYFPSAAPCGVQVIPLWTASDSHGAVSQWTAMRPGRLQSAIKRLTGQVKPGRPGVSPRCVVTAEAEPTNSSVSRYVHQQRNSFDLSERLVSWLEFSVPFQHKYGYTRDDELSERTVNRAKCNLVGLRRLSYIRAWLVLSVTVHAFAALPCVSCSMTSCQYIALCHSIVRQRTALIIFHLIIQTVIVAQMLYRSQLMNVITVKDCTNW